MHNLLLLAVVGLIAQLVDGALGMAYGATSTSLLLFVGLAPATASASVHLAEVGTTLASGISHWRFGNVDWRLVTRLGLPGALGAFLGATVLARLSTEAAAPVTSGVLLAIGVFLLARFAGGRRRVLDRGDLPTRAVAPLGLFAGFVDATGGGGWGPVATPSLLVTGRVETRKVIGTVDTAEFLVSLAASAGFLLGLGREGFAGGVVAALLVGGVLAAPVAAWLVRRVPEHLLGASVGGLMVLTNARTLLRAGEVDVEVRFAIYLGIVALWATALGVAHRRRSVAG